MAFLTRNDIIKKFGVSHPAISMNIKRGKLVLNSTWIDDSDPTNAATLARWGASFAEKSQPKTVTPPPRVGRKKATQSPRPSKKSIDEDEDYPAPAAGSGAGVVALDRELKVATIAFKIKQTEIAELKAAKMRGENIPTGLAVNAMSLLGHSMQSAYRNGAEALMIELSAAVKLPPAIEAKFRGRLIELVNKSHSNAIAAAKSEIKTIIDSATDGVEVDESNT